MWNGIGDLMSEFSDAAASISTSGSGAASPKSPSAALDSVAVGVFRRGARTWGSPRQKIPEAAVQFSVILEPEGDSEGRLRLHCASLLLAAAAIKKRVRKRICLRT
jgi:hypothetical protein